MENHDYVIIVAGGKGMRMGADVPKQFLPVGGLPVLMHTIRRFRNFNDRMRIIPNISRSIGRSCANGIRSANRL